MYFRRLHLSADPHLRYFVAASPSSIDRNVYSAKIPDLTAAHTTPKEPQALTSTQQSSWYSASFSPRTGFYALSYSGPGVPWQKIMQTNKPGTRTLSCSNINSHSQRADFTFLLNDNRRLNETSAQYQMPNIVRSTMMSDGYGECTSISFFIPNC